MQNDAAPVIDKSMPTYWLAVISDVNCDLLAGLGRPFYATKLSVLARTMKVGDRCALYRAKNRRGFVGIYEITAPAIDIPTKLGAVTFPTKIPWSAVLLAESEQVALSTLVGELKFVEFKNSAGAYFQTSLRRLSSHDYSAIETAVSCNAQLAGNVG